jgi:hypothetical protein
MRGKEECKCPRLTSCSIKKEEKKERNEGLVVDDFGDDTLVDGEGGSTDDRD